MRRFGQISWAAILGPTAMVGLASGVVGALGCTSIVGFDGDYTVGDTTSGAGGGSSGSGGSSSSTSTSGSSTSTSTSGGGGGGGEGGSSTSGTGGSGGFEPPCSDDEFECLSDGSAQECVNGSWESLGPCPLGCDANAQICNVPSNIEASAVGAGTANVVIAANSDMTFDSDTGEITSGSTVIRPAGPGLDVTSGIAFASQSQGSGQPDLGVFSMGTLTVQDEGFLFGVGDSALVLAVDGAVQIDGGVVVSAWYEEPGPGGFFGGAAGASGDGLCAGQPGSGTTSIWPNCTSGSGGAGYGGEGGPGGDCSCDPPDDYAGGLGGLVCGTPELIPLVGGSGGAGSADPTGDPTEPGLGGGGGGALQISCASAITIGTTGWIDAGGGGGGVTVSTGGAGGGAGGALLLEAPTITTAVGAVLAANGGGGGGGDCT